MSHALTVNDLRSLGKIFAKFLELNQRFQQGELPAGETSLDIITEGDVMSNWHGTVHYDPTQAYFVITGTCRNGVIVDSLIEMIRGHKDSGAAVEQTPDSFHLKVTFPQR